MTVTAIVPLKALPAAKGRLAAVLAPQDRLTLVTAMARHVLVTCLGSASVDRVLLVAGDAAGADLGRSAGVEVLRIDEPGLQRALDAADVYLAGEAVTAVVAADLPGATPDEVDAVVRIALDAPEPRVVIVPTRDGGTGALVRRPGRAIPTAYGFDSARRHAALAAAAGVHCVVTDVPGLATDVDTPTQLTALAFPAANDVGSRPH